MTSRGKVAVVLIVSLALTPAALLGRQLVLKNGSLEAGPGAGGPNPMVPANWVEFGPTVERSDEANHTPGGGYALKAFSSDQLVGAYQDVPVSPGNIVTISAYLYTRSEDKLGGGATAWITLAFYKSDHITQVGDLYPLLVLDAGSPADTWVPGSMIPHAAPAQSAYARMTCVWMCDGTDPGSAYWDDCSLTVGVGPNLPNLLINGDFETAGVGGHNPAGIDDWTGFNDQDQSTDVAKDGLKSVKVGVEEPYSGLVQVMAEMNAGDHLFMQSWAYNPSSDPLGSNSIVGLKLEWQTSGTVPPPKENLALDRDSPADEWTLVEINTNAPDLATVARIVMIYAADTSTNGSVYFDGAEAHVNGGGNVLHNASFEDGPGGGNGLEFWTEFKTPGVSQCWKECDVPWEYLGTDCSAKATGEAVAGVSQEIAVVPGDALSVRAYLYIPSAWPEPGLGREAKAGIKVEWAIGSVPTWVDICRPPSTCSNSVPAMSMTQDTWTPLTIDYTMAPGKNASAKFVNLIERGGAASGKVYFDACEGVMLNWFDGADADADDDEDLRDFAEFQRCFTGAVSGQMRWGCIVFDSDDDDDVDLADYVFFKDHMTGP
ncbi:MAG: hypothetical protein V2A79_14350 [Planctomycetota bacterium]